MSPEEPGPDEVPAAETPEAVVEPAAEETVSEEQAEELVAPEEPAAEEAVADETAVSEEPAAEDEAADEVKGTFLSSDEVKGTFIPSDETNVPFSEPEAAAEQEDVADPESDLVAAGDADALPDVTSDEALEAALEALLLVVDSPASEELLADTLGQSQARIVVALRTMAQKLTERASGIDLRRVGEGWRFYTRDTYAPFVEKLLLDGQRSKLTRAALESLAVIAYRQPVTRARVSAVRGVNVDGVIRTLLARGLIEEMGTDPETTGTLYVTTELFLERLGLSSLNDLPAIAPLLPEVDTIDDFQ